MGWDGNLGIRADWGLIASLGGGATQCGEEQTGSQGVRDPPGGQEGKGARGDKVSD